MYLNERLLLKISQGHWDIYVFHLIISTVTFRFCEYVWSPKIKQHTSFDFYYISTHMHPYPNIHN